MNAPEKIDGETRVATPLIAAAFATIYIVWGTTYLAMKLSLDSLPPLFISGIRFFLAGLIVYGTLRLLGFPRPPWRHWRNGAVVGTLLMGGGNGMVMLSIGNIPSGVAAVIVATMPLWMALFEWALYRGDRPNWRTVFGLGLGFFGIILLIDPFGGDGGGDPTSSKGVRLDPISCCVCLLAPMFWAIGSLQSRVTKLPSNAFMSVSVQMICGGAVILFGSLLKGEWGKVVLDQVSLQTLLAISYLIVFGSMIALTTYVWLLKHVSASRVSTYTYANPVIAVMLGWLILGEPITLRMLVAIAIVIAAVILIVAQRRSPPKIEAANDLLFESTPTITTRPKSPTTDVPVDAR